MKQKSPRKIQNQKAVKEKTHSVRDDALRLRYAPLSPSTRRWLAQGDVPCVFCAGHARMCRSRSVLVLRLRYASLSPSTRRCLLRVTARAL